MKDPLVSVVVITYNQAQYIGQAIRGILSQQTEFPVELIIADDCSTDNTAAVIKACTAKLPSNIMLCYHRHPVNLGMMANFLWALNTADGRYIALCEGDDYWTDPLKLQRQLKALQANPECLFSFHSAQQLDVNGHRQAYPQPRFLLKAPVVDPLRFIAAGAGIFCTATVLFKKELLKGLPAFFRNAPVGDLPLGLLAALRGSILYLPWQMAVYRRDAPGSWSLQMGDYRKRLALHQGILNTLAAFNQASGQRFAPAIRQLEFKEIKIAAHLKIMEARFRTLPALLLQTTGRLGLRAFPGLFKTCLYKFKKQLF